MSSCGGGGGNRRPKSSSGKTISVKPVNWSRVNACVTAENKKRKPRRARCIRKLKAQSFKL